MKSYILTNKIYGFLPVFFQHFAISVYGFFWKQRRYGGVFTKSLNEFLKRENFSLKLWNEYQLVELRKLLLHSFQTVPYYHAKFINLGFKNSDFIHFNFENLSKLPFLEKEDLRKFGTTTLLSKEHSKKGQFFSSSGSTGTPVKIYYSNSFHQKWSAAFEARIRNWAGLNKNSPRGMIGGRRVVEKGDANPPFHRYNFFEKQIYFSAYHISQFTSFFYWKAMRRHKIEYMTGYAVSNFVLARFLKENGLEFPLKAVITSSEKLTKEMKDLFREVYRCRTYDSYSGVEACGLISECEMGGLHVSPDVGIIEFLRSDGSKASPGEMAEIVCTGLLNFDQPLIRYKIGDCVILKEGLCSCGREMPLIQEIIGRREDLVIGKDGREMVRFHGIFIDLPNIAQGQIVQYSLDKFEINVVISGKIESWEKELIRKRMESQLGEIDLNINEVDFILPGPNGKFQAVISNVNRTSFIKSKNKNG